MRGLVAVATSLAGSLLVLGTGCEGVPDLHFADATDASVTSAPPSTEDGSIATGGGSSGGSSSGGAADAALSTDANVADSASTPADAAQPPGDTGAPPSTCPAHPPAGATCCGTVACSGNKMQCDCTACAKCAPQGVCCPQGFFPVKCVTDLAQCP